MTDYVRRLHSHGAKVHEAGEDGKPACQTAKTAGGETWVPADGDEAEKCSYCFGTVERQSNDGPSRAAEWSKLSPEDLGMTPMGERR